MDRFCAENGHKPPKVLFPCEHYVSDRATVRHCWTYQYY